MTSLSTTGEGSGLGWGSTRTAAEAAHCGACSAPACFALACFARGICQIRQGPSNKIEMQNCTKDTHNRRGTWHDQETQQACWGSNPYVVGCRPQDSSCAYRVLVQELRARGVAQETACSPCINQSAKEDGERDVGRDGERDGERDFMETAMQNIHILYKLYT